MKELLKEHMSNQEIFVRCIPLKEGSSTVIVSSDFGRTSGGGGEEMVDNNPQTKTL